MQAQPAKFESILPKFLGCPPKMIDTNLVRWVQRSRAGPGWDISGLVREELRKQGLRGTLWEDILAQHCTALGALGAGKPADAYAQLVSYTQPFLKARPPKSP